jgi:hypothetical protein
MGFLDTKEDQKSLPFPQRIMAELTLFFAFVTVFTVLDPPKKAV